MVLKIVQFNEPILRKKGSKITTFDAALFDRFGLPPSLPATTR